MSLTSYRAAPPRGGVWVGWRAWRRPTLPRLEAQYHGRWGFSRPSSGWDRVRAPRYGHQAVQPTLFYYFIKGVLGVGVLVCAMCLMAAYAVCWPCMAGDLELNRAIRTG